MLIALYIFNLYIKISFFFFLIFNYNYIYFYFNSTKDVLIYGSFILLLIFLIIISTAFLTLFERKKMSSFQHRLGPHKIGFAGILQPFSDALKLLFKEIIIPKNSVFLIFSFAPLLAATFGFFNWVVFPFHSLFSVISDINLGLLFIFAISSLHVYSIILAGWSSNSRYSFLGAVRSSAQLIAYDIAFSIIMLNIVLITKSLNLNEIIMYQKISGNLANYQFFLFLLFLCCCIAETNRHPFDLPEAESELVSGYNVEYSAINFALFFLGEYTSVLFMSFLVVDLFWSGWSSLFLLEFYIKFLLIVIIFIVLRAELPRYRYDQLMNFGWRIILPFSLYLFIWNFIVLFIFNIFSTNFLSFAKIILY